MSEGDVEDPTAMASNKQPKKKKKEKKRKRQNEEEVVEVETKSSAKNGMKEKKGAEKKHEDRSDNDRDGGNADQAGLDDKEVRRQARKEERAARRREKEESMEKIPKVDEHGIAYTKLQIKRMLKRVKQGLNPVPTEEEERQRLRNEAQLRREEEAELAGMMFKREDDRDEEKEGDDSENDGENEEDSGDDDADSDGDQGEGDGSDNEKPETTSTKGDQQPPKKKSKRSKPVPPDYTCMACSNKHTPVHWIYDCPDKKTMKGINNKKKKERGIHEPDSRKVFVSGLPFEIKVTDVQQIFHGCGEVVSCKLLKFNDTGRCNGQAYVSFTTDEAASKAIKLSGTMVNNTEDDSKKKKKSKDASVNKRRELKLKISRVLNRRKTKTNSGGEKK